MWTLEEALRFVRELQTGVATPNGFHLALGGGVLNNGDSNKDLDLYFLPRLGESNNRTALLTDLRQRVTDEQEIGSGGEDNGQGIYSYKSQFKLGTKRIDIFIVKEGVDDDDVG